MGALDHGIYGYDGSDEAADPAALLNLLADSVRSELLAPAVQVTKTAAQNTHGTANTAVALAFNVEAFDTHAMHDNTTNNSRLTCVKAGLYRVSGKAAVAVTNTDYTSVAIAKNGAQLAPSQTTGRGPSAGYARVATSLLVPLNTGDYVELYLASSATSSAISVGDCLFEAIWERVLP